MSEMEPDRFCLSDYENRYLNDMRKAYTLIGDEISEGVALRRIRNEMTGYESYAAASKLLGDMQSYWRQFLSKNREYKQAIVVAKLYLLAQKAEEIAESVDDLNTISKMFERAAKIEGLDKIDLISINPQDIQIGDVIITSDVSVLRKEETLEGSEEDE